MIRPGVPLRSATLDSPLGPLLAVANDAGIVLLAFSEPARLSAQLQKLSRHFPEPVRPGPHPLLDRLRSELLAYFSGERRAFSVPLIHPGTDFQRGVWTALQQIPYGQTRTYEQLADTVGRAGACRAVGTANRSNRLAILVPCHRVINKGGALGGYGGGLWRKQRLLELECGQTAL